MATKPFTPDETREFNNLTHNFAVMARFKATTTHKIAKALLLRGWFFCNGEGRDIKAKSVGCGIYEVWSVPKKF